MTRRIAMVLVAALAAGCNQPSVKEAKQEAQLRWQMARAKMQYGVAVEYFKAGQLEKAGEQVAESLAVAPEDAEARLLLGKVLIEQGHYTSAAVELARVCSQRPTSFEAAFMLGVAQEKAGRLDEALACYHKARALDPANPQPVMAAGEVLVAMSRLADAQAYVEEHMALAGEEPGMHELAGRLALMLEDYAQAAKAYAQALDLDPANVRYREALGQAQFRCRRYAEAAQTLRPLRTTPKYACPAWVLTMLGDCALAQGRPQEAREAFTAARALEPSNPRAWTNVAKASLAAGEAARAGDAAQEALRLDPEASDAMIVWGYALLREGKVQQALTMLGGAVEAFPNDVLLRCLLGKAHAAAGDPAQAAQCYAAAMKSEPDNPLPRELMAAMGPRARATE